MLVGAEEVGVRLLLILPVALDVVVAGMGVLTGEVPTERGVMMQLQIRVLGVVVAALETPEALITLVVQAALASSSFVIPHLYYHLLPQQEALR
jgi:hypothetical protein